MEKTARIVESAPPRAIETIVERLIPGQWRSDLVGDLREGYVSLPPYIRNSAWMVIRHIGVEARCSFNPVRSAGDAGALFIAFAGAPLTLPLVLTFAVVLGALVVSDAYTHRSPGAVRNSTRDAIVAVTFLIAAQSVIGILAPSLALPREAMPRSCALSLLIIAAWRAVFRPGDREPQGHSFWMILAMNAAWMTAMCIVIVTGGETGHGFLFGFLPVALFSMAKRMQQDSIVVRKRAPESLSVAGDSRDQLSRKKERLWNPNRTSTILEALGIGVVGLSFVFVFWNGLSGRVPNVDWLRVATNFIAFAALCVVWIFVRKANQAAIRAIDEEMKK